jgi:ketosteroid isomerase-like protein
VTEDDVRAFLEGYLIAWNDGDVDAATSFYAVPQIVVSEGATHFLETEDEVRAALSAQMANQEEAGADRSELAGLAVEALDDGVVLATVTWRLIGEDGRDLGTHATRYTLAPDESEPDQVPRIVATELGALE